MFGPSLAQRAMRAALCVLFLVAANPAARADPWHFFHQLWKPPAKRPLAPVTGHDTAIETLAREIDWLEHHIDRYGTVVAKVPDIWGEARLMKHRQEYEEVVARELYNFDEGRISGAQFIQDQAFLAAALAMQQAISGEEGNSSPEGGEKPPVMFTPAISIASTPPAPGNNPSQGTGTTDINLQYQGPIGSNTIFTKGTGANGNLKFPEVIELEQTEVLDQLSAYLYHLHALRRINEGDDTADAPGYSLRLVRIPVSILPGQRTRRGWGAEITVTAEPYLGPELLPMAYRDLVINDIVDQLAAR